MLAHRRSLHGVTFVEVMTAIACLALVSASLAGGIAFATERTEVARQRSIIAEHIQGRFETLRATRLSTPNYSVKESVEDPVDGVIHYIVIQELVQQVPDKPGLSEISVTANWSSRVGTQMTPQELKLVTRVIVDLPRAESELLVLASSQASYLPSKLDAPPQPMILDLRAYGITPGSVIVLRTVGEYFTSRDAKNQPAGPSSSLVAMFASQPSLTKNSTDVHRVPFAVKAGEDFDTTKYNSVEGDYSEDFLVGTSQIKVEVPKGGRYLLVGVLDDTSDNGGSIQIEVIKA